MNPKPKLWRKPKLNISRTAKYARNAFNNLEDLLTEIDDSDWSDYLTPEEYAALDKAYDVLAEFYKDMASLSKN